MVVFICVALRLANKNLNRCDAAPHGTLRCEVRDTLKRFNFYDCPTPPSMPPFSHVIPEIYAIRN